MDLSLSVEERCFRDEIRAWLDVNVPKDWAEWREMEFFSFVAEFESQWVSYLPVKAGVRFSM